MPNYELLIADIRVLVVEVDYLSMYLVIFKRNLLSSARINPNRAEHVLHVSEIAKLLLI